MRKYSHYAKFVLGRMQASKSFLFSKTCVIRRKSVYLFQNNLRQRVENPVWFASEFHQVFPIQPFNLNQNKSRNRKTHVKLNSNPHSEFNNSHFPAVRPYTFTYCEHKPAAVHVVLSRSEFPC